MRASAPLPRTRPPGAGECTSAAGEVTGRGRGRGRPARASMPPPLARARSPWCEGVELSSRLECSSATIGMERMIQIHEKKHIQ